MAVGIPLAGPGGNTIDTVNVEVSGRDTVSGSIRPAEERESYLIDLPRGATLKATAKPTSDEAPIPILDVLDPDLAVITRSPAAKRVKVGAIVAAMSGPYRVRICGDGERDGDFQLKIRAKMPKSWSAAATTDLAPEAEDGSSFGAGAGAVARFTLSATGKSDFTPQILVVTGPDEFTFAIAVPLKQSSRHVVKDVVLPASGEYAVRFKNAGAGAGRWKLKITLKTPKARKSSLDLTDDALAGQFAGEQAVFARTIDALGGDVSPPPSHELLGGISIDVPPGAITAPTLILISESEPFFVDDDLTEGGATFEFGPDGLSFAEDAIVTLPFDTQAYDDPNTEVSVALRDAETGEVQVVTGVVDVDAGTITFPTSHFSRFQPASPRPRPLVGGFVELELAGSLDPAFATSVVFGLNAVRGAAGRRSGNAVSRDIDRYAVTFVPDAIRGGRISGSREQRMQSGTVSAGRTLDLDFGAQQVSFERGRSPDVFIRREVRDGLAGVSLLLRRVKGRPSRSALAGEWHAIVLEVSAVRGSNGKIAIASVGQTFTLSVARSGKASARQAERSVTAVPFPGGTPTTQRDTRRPLKGSLRPLGAMARLEMEVGQRTVIDTIDLHPVVRGDALVGVTGAVLGDPSDPTLIMTRLVILTRKGEDGSVADLPGRSRFAGFDLGLVAGDIDIPAAGARFDVLGLDVEHDGAGALRARGNGITLSRGISGGPQLNARSLDFTSTYDIAKDLGYREDAPFDRGVILARRGLYISTHFADDRVAIGFGVPSRPLDR